MSKRALIYARVSYDDRKNEDRNLEGQLEDYRAYCQEKGYRIVAELAEDDRGASGADWDLPKLNEALDMARAGEADVLVTRELDRFARKLAKQLVVEDQFRRYGVDVEYTLAEYEDTPEGQLQKNVRAVIAEYERLKIEERMTRGRRNMVKAGKVMLHGTGAPYGYRVENVLLVIYEPEAKIVRLIYTWYVYGDEKGQKLSIRAIAKRLTEMRIPTWADTHRSAFTKKRQVGAWSEHTVRSILGNETYAGVWHYAKKNGAKRNNRDHWLAIEVPAIIDRETWEKAQERKEYNREMGKRNDRGHYLLSKRVWCGQCAQEKPYKMHGRGMLKGKYRYYTCPATAGRIPGKTCDNKHFRADHVDAAVWEWVKSWLSNPEALREGLEAQQAEQERANKPLYDRLAVTDDLLADNRRQLEKLLDLYLSGDFDKTMLTDRKTRLETTITALEKERADLVTTLEASTLTDDQIATIEDFAEEVSEGLTLAEEDFEARRHIIDLLDVRVTLAIEDGQKIAYVRCLVDETALSVEVASFGTIYAGKCNPLLLLAPDT